MKIAFITLLSILSTQLFSQSQISEDKKVQLHDEVDFYQEEEELPARGSNVLGPSTMEHPTAPNSGNLKRLPSDEATRPSTGGQKRPPTYDDGFLR